MPTYWLKFFAPEPYILSEIAHRGILSKIPMADFFFSVKICPSHYHDGVHTSTWTQRLYYYFYVLLLPEEIDFF